MVTRAATANRAARAAKVRPQAPEALAAASGEVQVDQDGRVWRVRRYGRPCAPYRAETPGVDGALVVALYLAGRRWRVPAHRLVYHLHVGAIPPGAKLTWRDGDRANNRPGNLTLYRAGSTDRVDGVGGGD